jgi:hypothetical protein
MTAHDIATLESIIEKAFEERDSVNTSTRGEVRDAVTEALNLLDAGKARVAERQADGNWSVNQWLKKAVLLSFRLNPMEVISGGPGGSQLVGQGAVQVRRLERARFRGSRLPRRAELRRAPLRLYRQGRGADAVLRQSRRLCRRGHDGRHLGHRRLLRADRQERASVRRRRHRRRAGADAGRPDHHRGQLLHRRAFGSRRRL